MNLYERLSHEIEDHRDFWDYYGGEFGNVLNTDGLARDFIYKYFKRGSKAYAAEEWNSNSDAFVQERTRHTVNAFFIGVMLQRKIDSELAIKSDITKDYPFSYFWYLACLAHDFGYVYENYSDAYLSINPIKIGRRRCFCDKQYRRFLPRGM